MSEPLNISIDRPDTNCRFGVVLVPQYAPPDPRAALKPSPSGSPGIYRTTFVFAVPGDRTTRSELSAATIAESGSSLIVPNAPEFKVTLTDYVDSAEIHFMTNGANELSRAQMRIKAANFYEAQRVASDKILPCLSQWSFQLDVAIDVAGWEVVEEATNSHRWVFSWLGRKKGMNVRVNPTTPALASKPVFRSLFAAYREALNATNFFYQFLCYFKVVEGVVNVRAQRREAMIAAGKTPLEPAEVVPTAGNLGFPDWLVSTLAPYRGRKFTYVRDKLRGVVRNAVAHLDPLAYCLEADRFEDVDTCERAIPLIKYVAREMLRSELALDPEMARMKIA